MTTICFYSIDNVCVHYSLENMKNINEKHEVGSQAARQTGRQAGRQTDRQTDRQAGRQADR